MKANESFGGLLIRGWSACAGWTLILLVALCALSCSDPFGTRASSGGSKASLTVSFSVPTARTIVASSDDFSSAISTLSIAVVDSTSTTVAEADGIAYSSGITKTFDSLTPGTYTITVDAYSSADALIASGSSLPVDLAADTTQSVTVGLSFSQSSSTGGFSLAIQWPLSTGLAYVSATLDGAAMADPTVTPGSTDYTATLAKSGLSGGGHTLCIRFKTSIAAGTVGGLYVEAVNIWDGVTSGCWVDASGACVSTRIFASTDFFNTNANLGGLVVQDESTSGSVLSTGFSSSTTSYDLYVIPPSSSIVLTPTESVAGQYITYSWNGGAAIDLASGSASTSLAFVTSAFDNTLAITVRALDGATTKTYTFTWHSAAAAVDIGVPGSSSHGLGLPSSAFVVQGQAFGAETSDSTLDAIASGWTWYLDGAVQAETSQRFVLPPSATASMLGTYQVAGTVTSGGVSYSGRIALTVTRMADLGMDPASAVVTTLAGSTTSGSADGTGSAASFYNPGGVTTDGTYIYVADYSNQEIRKVSIATGVVTTLAGSTTSGSADGIGSVARFYNPSGITTDGTNLYVADMSNNEIRKVVIATGAVTTFAGSTTAGSDDGTGTTARFCNPSGIATDGTNLYVADYGNNEIRQIVVATGAVTTLAGSTTVGSLDGTGIAAQFKNPYGLTMDGTGLYVTDYGNNEIRQVVVPTGVVTTLAGSTTSGSADGTASAASFHDPAGITTDGINLYVADYANNEIRKIVIATGAVTTLAGSTSAGPDNGTGTAAKFNEPSGIATDGTNLYVGDCYNHEIRAIQP